MHSRHHRQRPMPRYAQQSHIIGRMRRKIAGLRSLLCDALRVTMTQRNRISSLQQQLAATDLNLAEAHETIRELRAELTATTGVPA